MTGGKFKLSKSNRASLEAAADEAARFGAEVSYNMHGARQRHPKFTVHLNGRERTSPFSGTPNAGEFAVNFVRQRVRQMVRAMLRDSDAAPRRPEGAEAEGQQRGACEGTASPNPSPTKDTPHAPD